MTEEQIKKLKFIRDEIKEGSYKILSIPMWDEFSRDLSNIGATLLNDLEQKRDCVLKLKVCLFFFLTRKQLNKLGLEYNEITKNFNLFFDASMRWLKSITDGDKYEKYQILIKQYVEALSKHCSRVLDYLSSLISAKRNDYYHYQALFISVMAVVIAVLSLSLKVFL